MYEGVAAGPMQFRSLLEEHAPWLVGFELLLALLVVALGIYVSKLLVRLLGRPVARRFARQSVAHTMLRGIRALTLLAAVLLAGWVAGLTFPDIVLSVTVFSAVVGIVLAPLLGSFINGLFVLADQPYEIGDMIELDEGTLGFVEDITIRYTKVLTLDNTFLIIPNANLRERDVTNYSAEDERTRRTTDLLVTYKSDVEEAKRIAEAAARECDQVITGGPDIRVGSARYVASPTCRIHQFADNGILLRLRYWARTPYKPGKVRSEVNERIWRLAADADVEMAYPHRHLVFDETSGSAHVSLGDAGERADGERPADADEAEEADEPEDRPRRG